jgi:hypothetical protein
LKFVTSGVFIPQTACQAAHGFRIHNSFVHAFGVASCGESLQQSDETFSLAPVANAEGKPWG